MSEVVMRPVRRVTHFDPKPEADLKELEQRDPELGALMRKRKRTRPFGHDIIDLRCGHTVFRVRPSKTYLWVRLPCEMCTRREAELSARYEAGEVRRQQDREERAELARLGDEAMAKAKKAAKAKASERAWHQSYRWTKALKLEPEDGTLQGSIYNAMKTVKHGNVDDITAQAVKNGLSKLTKQDPRRMTQAILRQFAEKGCCEIVRDDAPSEKKTEKKADAPKGKVKKLAKKLVLRKAPAAAQASA